MNAQTAATTKSRHVVPHVAEAYTGFCRIYPGLVASLGFAALLLLAQSDAALAQTAPPSLAKGFNPVVINAGGTSQMTITLTNPNLTSAILAAPLPDTLPLGVVVAPTPNASTTCGGSTTVAAVAGGTTVTLPSGRTIPAGAPGTCTITVDVTAATAGSYVNTLVAGALQTTNGDSVAPASATLSVVIAPIPTLSEWAMIILATLLAIAGLTARRRRAR